MRLSINRIVNRNIIHCIMNTLHWNLIRGTVRLKSVSLPFNILYCIILYSIMSGESVSMHFIMSGEGISLYCIMSGEGGSMYCIMSGEGVSLYCIMSRGSVCLPFNILPCNMMYGRDRLTINIFVKVQSIKVGGKWLVLNQ